jgi:hypothetical protein
MAQLKWMAIPLNKYVQLLLLPMVAIVLLGVEVKASNVTKLKTILVHLVLLIQDMIDKIWKIMDVIRIGKIKYVFVVNQDNELKRIY